MIPKAGMKAVACGISIRLLLSTWASLGMSPDCLRTRRNLRGLRDLVSTLVLKANAVFDQLSWADSVSTTSLLPWFQIHPRARFHESSPLA